MSHFCNVEFFHTPEVSSTIYVLFFYVVLHSILGHGVFSFFLSWDMQLLNSFPGFWGHSGRCRAAVCLAHLEVFVNWVARYIKCEQEDVALVVLHIHTHTHKRISISLRQRQKKRWQIGSWQGDRHLFWQRARLIPSSRPTAAEGCLRPPPKVHPSKKNPKKQLNHKPGAKSEHSDIQVVDGPPAMRKAIGPTRSHTHLAHSGPPWHTWSVCGKTMVPFSENKHN